MGKNENQEVKKAFHPMDTFLKYADLREEIGILHIGLSVVSMAGIALTHFPGNGDVKNAILNTKEAMERRIKEIEASIQRFQAEWEAALDLIKARPVTEQKQ